MRFFLAIALTFPLALIAKEKKSTPDKSTEVELDKFVVTDSPPGSIPFASGWRYNIFTGSIAMPPVIGFVGPKDQALPMVWSNRHGKQQHGFLTWGIPAADLIALRHGGQILAIDGTDVTTLDSMALAKLVREGKAGEPVTLIIRGCGDEMHLFREITVRRISERKEKRLLDEAASRELRPARSLAELPATPEPTP
jgi:hypothetical protein